MAVNIDIAEKIAALIRQRVDSSNERKTKIEQKNPNMVIEEFSSTGLLSISFSQPLVIPAELENFTFKTDTLSSSE